MTKYLLTVGGLLHQYDVHTERFGFSPIGIDERIALEGIESELSSGYVGHLIRENRRKTYFEGEDFWVFEPDTSSIIKETLEEKNNVYHADGVLVVKDYPHHYHLETTHFIGTKKDLLDVLQGIVPENALGADPLTDLKSILKYLDPRIQFKHKTTEEIRTYTLLS